MRRPELAALANLLAAPLGHVYLGEVRRGLLLWLAVQLVLALAVVLLILRPGLLTALLMALAPVGLGALLVIDALVLALRSASGYRPRPYGRWYIYAGTAVLAVLLGSLLAQLRRTQVQPFRIPSESMRPTLLAGDYLFADKASHRRQGLRRGDLVVCSFPSDPSQDFVKRIVGLPYDVIEIRDKQVLINRVPLPEPYAVHTDPSVRPGDQDPRDNFGPYAIGPYQYFVMGDSRENSADSRYRGVISGHGVKGRATVLYWSWDDARWRPRWERVGMRIR